MEVDLAELTQPAMQIQQFLHLIYEYWLENWLHVIMIIYGSPSPGRGKGLFYVIKRPTVRPVYLNSARQS